MTTPRWVPFAKGHGTGNDFVILPDLHAELDLSAAVVAALCDRRTGIGGDGVLRVVPAAKDPASVAQAGEAEWFMDYRNADGSLAEMCGNGARVFAHYLVCEGLAEPGALSIATRDGVKQVHVHSVAGETAARACSEVGAEAVGSSTVEFSLPRVGQGTTVIVNGTSLPAMAANAGNPHAVCIVQAPLGTFDFSTAPGYDSAFFDEGVTVELITVPQVVSGAASAEQYRPQLRIEMRVYERGSGETRSCGTGAVAAAAVALRAVQPQPSSLTSPMGTVWVDLPGGQLRIELTETAALLTGPAVIVAKGHCLL